MTYYEEDNPEITTEELVERMQEAANTKPMYVPVLNDKSQERHDELMEMLGGIFVQLSRVYDTLMFVVSAEHQKVLDDMHSRGELFASPPSLTEKAWGEDEAVSDKD